MKNCLLILMSVILTSSMVLAAPATRPAKKVAAKPVAKAAVAREVSKDIILTDRLSPYAFKTEVVEATNAVMGTVNTELGKKADTTYVDAEVGKKADKTYVDTEIGKKADTETVNAALALKADKTELTSATNTLSEALALKANKDEVETELAKKADILDLIVYNEDTELYEAQRASKGLSMTGTTFGLDILENGFGYGNGAGTYYLDYNVDTKALRIGNGEVAVIDASSKYFEFLTDGGDVQIHIGTDAISVTDKFALSEAGISFGDIMYSPEGISKTTAEGEIAVALPSKSGTIALVEDALTEDQVNTLIANAIKAAVETGITIDGVNYKLVVDTVAQ